MMAAQHIEPGFSLRSLLLGIVEVGDDVNVSMLTLNARDITIGGLFLAVSGTQSHGSVSYTHLTLPTSDLV